MVRMLTTILCTMTKVMTVIMVTVLIIKAEMNINVILTLAGEIRSIIC